MIVPDLPRHIPSLNGLRALSIILVIIAHAGDTRGAPAWLRLLKPFGNLGVRVFFLISGFLITTLLLRECGAKGRIALGSFYARRTLRIFPGCCFYIAVVALLRRANLVELRPGDLAHALTYTMNYHVDRAWALNHLWSLSVEEQFYLLWPILMVALGPRRAIRVAALSVLAAPFIRAIMWYALQSTPTAMTREFQAVGDSLALGCLLASRYNWLGGDSWYAAMAGSRLFAMVPIVGIILSMGTYLINQGVFYVLGQSLVNLMIAAGIESCIRRPAGVPGRLCNMPAFDAIGTLSYSLYLWQELFLNPFDYRSHFTAFPQNIGLAIAAAWAARCLVERPFLRLKDWVR